MKTGAISLWTKKYHKSLKMKTDKMTYRLFLVVPRCLLNFWFRGEFSLPLDPTLVELGLAEDSGEESGELSISSSLLRKPILVFGRKRLRAPFNICETSVSILMTSLFSLPPFMVTSPFCVE